VSKSTAQERALKAAQVLNAQSGTQANQDQNNYNIIVQKLNDSKGTDGYVNTAVYTQLKDQYPGVFAKWIKPQEWLNPNDATAQKYFQTATGTLKTVTQEQKDALVTRALNGETLTNEEWAILAQ
jgi:hypothetical protein